MLSISLIRMLVPWVHSLFWLHHVLQAGYRAGHAAGAGEWRKCTWYHPKGKEEMLPGLMRHGGEHRVTSADLSHEKVISIPSTSRIPISKLSRNSITSNLERLVPFSLSQRPSSNLAWSLCNLPLMVTGGCHQGGNQSWYFLVGRCCPGRGKGKGQSPKTGAWLSPHSLWVPNTMGGSRSWIFFIVLGSDPGLLSQGPAQPILSLLKLLWSYSRFIIFRSFNMQNYSE